MVFENPENCLEWEQRIDPMNDNKVVWTPIFGKYKDEVEEESVVAPILNPVLAREGVRVHTLLVLDTGNKNFLPDFINAIKVLGVDKSVFNGVIICGVNYVPGSLGRSDAMAGQSEVEGMLLDFDVHTLMTLEIPWFFGNDNFVLNSVITNGVVDADRHWVNNVVAWGRSDITTIWIRYVSRFGESDVVVFGCVNMGAFQKDTSAYTTWIQIEYIPDILFLYPSVFDNQELRAILFKGGGYDTNSLTVNCLQAYYLHLLARNEVYKSQRAHEGIRMRRNSLSDFRI